MKTSNKILLGLLATFTFFILSSMIVVRSNLVPKGFGDGETAINGSNVINTIKPTLSDFNSLDLSGIFNVTLIPGRTFLEIEGEDNILKLLSIQIYPNKQLEIKAKEGYTLHPNDPINIKVGFDTLNAIHLVNQVKLEATKPLNFEEIKLTIFQTSSIDLNLTAQILSISASNSSEINLAGSVQNLTINTFNSAGVNAAQLPSKKVSAKSHNSSSLQVHAEDHLKAEAYNNSRIYYKGEPAKITRRASNSSQIKQE